LNFRFFLENEPELSVSTFEQKVAESAGNLMDKNNQPTQPNQMSLPETLSSQSGLALVLVDESAVVSKANNNSICDTLYDSAEFAPRCAMFCGKAFAEATEAGKTISNQCHAGLFYQAVPLKNAENKQLVAITGRTFLHLDDYRKATDRAHSGDWKNFPPVEFLSNVSLSSSEQAIEKLSRSLEKLSAEERELLWQTRENEASDNDSVSAQNHKISDLIEQLHQSQEQLAIAQSAEKNTAELKEIAVWRALFGSLLNLSYAEACISVAEFLAKRYRLEHLAWLENNNGVLESIWASGSLKKQHFQIGISTEDKRLAEVFQRETSLELHERKTPKNASEKLQKINLFPIAIRGMVRSALAVSDELTETNQKRRIARSIRHVASELEILRLREEIEYQTWLTKAIQRINSILKEVDAENFWTRLVQYSAELMQTERSSLLIFDDESQDLQVKAATGNKAEVIKEQKKIGERIAHNVLQSGRPLIVKDVKKSGIPSAPADWKYKTDSFISYPITIGKRKIGVLNLTDKIDGSSYNEKDLEILHTLAPQIAIALDRITLIRQASDSIDLAMTDGLTGLRNRRYLEIRLAEEISRSQRHGYPMCFMMIDVDKFKSYNDTFGHPEGDKALQLVGQCLKSALRGADIAARYGGEEFSILLPQTNLKEGIIIAERVREKVETTRFPNRTVTVSIGLASCTAELCVAGDLIAAADAALYQAKMNGRNRVAVYRRGEGEER
jgi:diguanylate cyclase (GGDEF)-like protein